MGTLWIDFLKFLEGLCPTTLDGDFSDSVDMEVTINCTTKTLTFNVVGEWRENDEIRVVGNSELSLEEFGIEAPSLLGVYGVADDVDLAIDVIAKKQ